MLLCKDRGRYKIYNLLSFRNGLECGTDRDLCFTVSDITAYQTVHDL